MRFPFTAAMEKSTQSIHTISEPSSPLVDEGLIGSVDMSDKHYYTDEKNVKIVITLLKGTQDNGRFWNN